MRLDILRRPLAALVVLCAGAVAAPAATVTTTCTGYCSAFPPAPSVGGLNIQFQNVTVLVEGILEVNVIGAGGGPFTYPDLNSAPGPAGTTTAIADAFAFLGLGAATPVSSSSLTALSATFGTVETFMTFVQPGTVFIGDLDDYISLIVLSGEIDVLITDTTTTLQPYRLDVTLAAPAAVPLPAGAPLLAAGLASLGLAARRVRRDREPGRARLRPPRGCRS